jgi:probable 2-oxoglutarate dehydrogenase E1 component DHKTD1
MADQSKTQRILLVSGKLYYELVKERAARRLENEVAIIRVEELCPFPFARLKSTLQPFFQQGSNPRIAWVQEEAENQGGWPHVMPRLLNTLKGVGLQGKGVDVEYVGREPSEVPAVGFGKLHAAQNVSVLKGAFDVRA